MRAAGATGGASVGGGGIGTLKVNCIPWCKIYIDGKDTGRRSPALDLKVPAGKHRLKVVHPPNGMERFRDVEVRAGEATLAVIEF
ncbi:MAG: PEGA domain-containing protein [Deltaproteobacteria bacterium]|nr:MAG: PEGA domain-containing protein [Deltaproteobacteria bacterium]